MRWTQAWLVAGLAAVMVAPAMAQRPDGQRRGGGGFGFGGGQVNVFSALRSEAVQKELALTEDQKSKATELNEKVGAARREAFGGFGGGDQPREEREKRMAEIREKTDKINADNTPALAAILSADQMTRLEQIVLQVKGAEALNEKEIQAKLMVTDEQKGKLESVTKEFGDKMGALFRRPEGGGQPDREGFRAAMEKRTALTKERNDALLAVLTPAQAEQFDLMKGKAFADIESLRNPGFGGGRGPGGPGGPGGGRGGDRPQRPATEN